MMIVKGQEKAGDKGGRGQLVSSLDRSIIQAERAEEAVGRSNPTHIVFPLSIIIILSSSELYYTQYTHLLLHPKRLMSFRCFGHGSINAVFYVFFLPSLPGIL